MKEISERDVAIATVDAFEMWTDPRYIPFLRNDPAPKTMGKKWFDEFLGDWRIARTISLDKREEVRIYLNTDFCLHLQENGAAAIDMAASKIALSQWTHKNQKSGKWSKPVSLVSKVAFFFQPDKYVPLDQYSRKGVKKLLQLGHRKLGTYEEYLSKFESSFLKYKGLINDEHKCAWVKALAAKYGCSPDVIKTDRFKRKVFDNILMKLGGR